MKVKVYVSLRESVLDPQGQAICEALNRTGYDFVTDVRVSKVFELEINGEPKTLGTKSGIFKAEIYDAKKMKAIREQVEKFAGELLANPIIETFRIEEEEEDD
ncbi:MAG: phosphoribosylformylglycinamidine synthase subunit PurS [Deferribacteraceae bacterium]|jgi:phosphoribosylformylglycinamidine synthase|nr:phosphoribosylformylglycinamidine synthase subunit PurS [Deferribacteraceae bacterium]